MLFSADSLRRFFQCVFCILCPALWASGARAQIHADFDTSGGNFTLEMFHRDAPMAVANFIGLADGSLAWLDNDTLEVRNGAPFYDGIIFHRVIKDFMIQGGSPNGRGTDGPGYKFVDQFARDAGGALLRPHDQQGLISMANSGINTNGSQFFITDVPTPHLNGKHIVFGKIAAGPFGTLEEGIAVITVMNDTPTTGSKPDVDLVINSITIRRVGDEAMAFDVHAQGLPVITAPQAHIVVDDTAETVSAELRYAKTALSQVDVLASGDFRAWETQTTRYYGDTDPSADDITGVFNEKASRFFRLVKVDYSPQPLVGGPESLANGTLKLAFDAIFAIDVTIDGSGGDGVWSRPDGGGGGTLESVAYTPRAVPLADVVEVRYEGLVPNSDFVFAMRMELFFDTATSGRFKGTTNGSPQSVSGTFEFVP